MTIDNPYAAPTAAVAEPAPAAARIPDEVTRQIRNGWVAATLSAVLTLALVVVAMTSGEAVMGFDAWALVDVAIMFGLAFGIYKRSRACAVIMLAYFVLSKILMMVEAGKPNGLLVAFIFGYFYFQAVKGTYEYHRIVAAAR